MKNDTSLPLSVIHLKGKITDKVADEFSQVAESSKVRQLWITSAGGTEARALRIGVALQQNHIPIVVDRAPK